MLPTKQYIMHPPGNVPPYSAALYFILKPQAIIIGILVVSIIGIIAAMTKWKYAFVLRIIFSIIGIVLLIAFPFQFDTNLGAAPGLLQIKYFTGYWLILIVFALVAIVNLFPKNLRIHLKNTSIKCKIENESPW